MRARRKSHDDCKAIGLDFLPTLLSSDTACLQSSGNKGKKKHGKHTVGNDSTKLKTCLSFCFVVFKLQPKLSLG